MARELYVGSISYNATESDLEKLFSVVGRVTSIHLITDPVNGQFRGCAYVRMSSAEEAKDAIVTLDGALLIDRVITVTESRPPKDRPAKPGFPRVKAAGDKKRATDAPRPTGKARQVETPRPGGKNRPTGGGRTGGSNSGKKR